VKSINRLVDKIYTVSIVTFLLQVASYLWFENKEKAVIDILFKLLGKLKLTDNHNT